MKVALWIALLFALLVGMNVAFFTLAMSSPDPPVEVEGYAR